MAGNSARTAALAALLTLAAGCVVEEAARTAVGNVKGLLDLDKRSEKEALAKEGDLGHGRLKGRGAHAPPQPMGS